MNGMTELYIGTSGWTYATWRERFYPKGVAQRDWLAYYAQHYKAVEINATFYRAFPDTSYTRWHDAVPPDFRFALKGPKVITHEKVLVDIQAELDQFVDASSALGEKRGVLLWQFPAILRADEVLLTRLARFVERLPLSVPQVFEFRHLSWYTEGVVALLQERQVSLVTNDSPRMPRYEAFSNDPTYVRFHGPGKLYDSRYSVEDLQNWAIKLAPRMQAGDMYLFFNNTMSGQALENAVELRSLLTK